MNLMKKNCLILGSQSSIGMQIKKIFKDNNFQVFGTSRKFQNSISKEEIFLDFFKNDSLNKLSNQIPNIDSLIFCNGLLVGKQLSDYQDEEINKVFESNILGTIKVLSRIQGKLNNKCSVVFIGSISGSAGSYDEVYAASKSAIYALMKSLAKKSTNGVRFNCISPGLIEDSAMFSQFTDLEIKNHIKQIPTKKLNLSANIAKVCFDICQEEWSQMNGQVINVNGGRYV